ncbi:response regulator [Exilibacterium tricleocarpae]|uniref:histidine kinase n=1 Tax=Exilibacterium tricleocarpae TaxID=2591008 RepID=A0A545T3K8_9GAMM|nr:response regulator [Exilibacterium tricleocarpae]TQV71796.1 response regulator [Exilibacterium tricleocarpae]
MYKPPRPQSILLVDDNDVNRQLVRHILADTYPLVYEAADGNECLATLQKYDIDLVLLDLNMPEKSGFEVLTELQRNGAKRNPAVIVVSADSDPASISRTFQLGAADYVTTPFNRYELLARVHTHLALHNREQELEERVQERTAELMETNRRLQETHGQLLQAEKMVSLGQLAAGVAHEINNPVGYISSNMDTLRAYFDDLLAVLDAYQETEESINNIQIKDELQELKCRLNLDFLKEDIPHLVDESLQGVRRVKQIVADLKGFSHPEQQEWQQVDLHDTINSALNIVHGQLKYKAEVVKQFGELPPIECIAPQINQVLVNLLVNAGQAIEGRGTITLVTGLATDIKTRVAGDAVFVSVSDTGIGMSADTQMRIFDPFFTSKPVGEGTGLGLSVSYGIIENHRGEILVDSRPQQGSCFTLILPVTQTGAGPGH